MLTCSVCGQPGANGCNPSTPADEYSMEGAEFCHSSCLAKKVADETKREPVNYKSNYTRTAGGHSLRPQRTADIGFGRAKYGLQVNSYVSGGSCNPVLSGLKRSIV